MHNAQTLHGGYGEVIDKSQGRVLYPPATASFDTVLSAISIFNADILGYVSKHGTVALAPKPDLQI
jgi:hypothetical protein